MADVNGIGDLFIQKTVPDDLGSDFDTIAIVKPMKDYSEF